MKNRLLPTKRIWADSLAVLMRLQFLTLFGLILAQVFGKTGVASGLFTVTFFLTALIWVCQGMLEMGENQRLAMLTVMVSGISVAGNCLLAQNRISFGYVRKWVMFCTSVLFLAVCGDYKPGEKEVKILLKGSTGVGIFLAGMYFVQPEKMYLFGGKVSQYLTFRFTNPNLTAVFLTGITLLQWVQMRENRGFDGALFAGLGGFLSWCVVKTRSRNALLVLVFFLLVLALAGLGYGIVLEGWLRWMAAAFPLVFALGYLLLVRLPAVERLLSFLTGAGKALDSRVWIWELALEQTGKNPLLGAYSQISGGTGVSQLHNSHLDVLASYGVVTLCLVCLLLYRLLEPVGRGRGAYLCRMGFLTLLLAGMGEAMLFSGGMGVYLLFGGLRLLANYDFEEAPL